MGFSKIVLKIAAVLGITYDKAAEIHRDWTSAAGGKRDWEGAVRWHQTRDARDSLQRTAERSGHRRSEGGRFTPPKPLWKRGRRKEGE